MKVAVDKLQGLRDPENYLRGVGRTTLLPIPRSILFFLRETRQKLQQEALQNRSHHRFVLLFNLETSGSVHVDNRVLPLTPGQALLIHPFQFHHFTHLASSALRWLFCTFELEQGRFLEPLRNRVLGPQKGTVDALDLLLTDWHRCNRQTPPSEMQVAQLQSALLYLLVSLREDLQTVAPDLPPEPRENLIRDINQLMAEWRGRPVVVSNIADALGLSTSRLRARFRQTAGVSLGSYMMNYRLHRAMALLRTSSLPIAEIAEETGFGSPQAFSRTFRKKIGRSARDYRRV
jgi:AraC-like DNA-binding protein